MTQQGRTRVAWPADDARIATLVASAGLPTVGLDQAWTTLVVEDSDDELAGVAALERHGPDHVPAFLLRSVVVRADCRGTGLGRTLVHGALSVADAYVGGHATVGLLTETADDYFDRFGFHAVARDQLPAALFASVELASACPDNARAYLRG
jgi:amino-acid N-acetyltransferase